MPFRELLEAVLTHKNNIITTTITIIFFHRARTRFYIQDELLKLQQGAHWFRRWRRRLSRSYNVFGERKEAVRWAEDPVKFDVVSGQDLKTAASYGKVLVDMDLRAR